jgi:hypothetical protein
LKAIPLFSSRVSKNFLHSMPSGACRLA